MIRTILLSALVTLSFTACSKKSDSGSSGAAKTTEKAGGGGSTKMPKLGLELAVSGVEVTDGIGGDGVTLMGGNIGAMSVELDKDPATEATVKDDADLFNAKNFKPEKLADGFGATYENTGSGGANYFINYHRTIDGKQYHCSSMVATPDQQKAVTDACKSLKKG
jgi:hypothetical protein